MLENVNYNIDLGGARLLGKDAARIMAPPTRAQVVALLDDRAHRERLVTGIAGALKTVEDPVAEAEALITQFTNGLADI